MPHAVLAAALLLTASLIPGAAAASTAADICAPSADPCVVSNAQTVDPGSTLDFGTRQLDVTSTGSITVVGGKMTILAGTVRLESNGVLIGAASGTSGGSIAVTTSGDIRVETGASGDGAIDVSDNNYPGEIDLVAHGSFLVAGQVRANGGNNQASGGVINGTVDGAITITGAVRAQGGSAGVGGEVTLKGGSASVTGTIRVDAGCAGDIEIDSTSGDISAGGPMNASSSASSGDGGSVTLVSAGNLSVTGSLSLGAQGDLADGGGTGGDVDLEGNGGTLTLSGAVDTHGAAPDGCAGGVCLTAATDIFHTGTIDDSGHGGGAGGLVAPCAGRLVSFGGLIDVSGGSCGGCIDVDPTCPPATATASPVSELSADGGFDAGQITIAAQTITASGKLHAIGTTSNALAGLVQLTGCTVSVPSGATIKTDGASNGENLLQASGQMTVNGTLSSRPGGKNRLEYRDSTKPPNTIGATIQPAPDCSPGCLNPNLVACAATSVCGNHIVEPGEQCDDGNTAPCDGCSPTCQKEVCGNGTIDCGEECDDGAANGAPGDPCDTSCHMIQSSNVEFIPGGHRGGHACWLEWMIQEPSVGGFPSTAQSCIDGDPACDADGKTDGVCTFHVGACLNVTDPRLPACHLAYLDHVNQRHPSPLSPADGVEAANAQVLEDALAALGVTVTSGSTLLRQGETETRADQCTQVFVQRVPHLPGAVGRRILSAGTKTLTGEESSNRISLSCLPNPAVCGNGKVEIGEECDDGNTTPCDGCSATCQKERCGNGVVECAEQCDDGPSNGTPGDPCSATCTEAPPPGRIPGGKGAHDCLAEWALATSQLATSKSGLPLTKQMCVDGDPACDFDSTPGSCRFHLWTCVAGADSRIGCAADTVGSLALLRPSATKTGSPAAARQALVAAYGRMNFPAGPGEVCSERVDIDVPVGHKLALKDQALSGGGVRDRDGLKLSCAPAGTAVSGGRRARLRSSGR